MFEPDKSRAGAMPAVRCDVQSRSTWNNRYAGFAAGNDHLRPSACQPRRKRQESQERLVMQGHKDLKDQLDFKVLMEMQDLKDHRDLKV